MYIQAPALLLWDSSCLPSSLYWLQTQPGSEMEAKLFVNWSYMWRAKKETDHSILVGSRITKQGKLHMGLLLGHHMRHRSLHPSARIFEAYIEDLTGSGHIFSPDSLNNTFISQSRILGAASCVEIVDRMYILRTGNSVRNL